MNTALVLAPAWSREWPHLAIAMLSACLRKKTHNVSVFDLNNDFYFKCKEKYKTKWQKENDLFWTDAAYISEFASENKEMIDHAVKDILSADVSVVGFSVYYPNELMSLLLARRIKEIDRKKIIIFGGFQCLRELKGKAFIADPAVDIVVIGEGDETLVELAEIIERDGKVDFCKGALLKKDNAFIDCGDRPPIKNLDSLPFSDFRDFSLPMYEQPDTLPFLSSRSCFQGCVYCTVKTFWHAYRSMSGERIFQEIKYQLKNFTNVNNIFFHDPLINGNIKELSKLCSLISKAVEKKEIPAIRWCAEGIVRSEMTPELLTNMKKAGCYTITYGIESGSQKVLDDMGKNFKIIVAERVIRDTHAAGIKVELNFMIGFPTETEEDFQKTLDFIIKNRDYIDEVFPSDSFCYIDKGTYLYEHSEEFGILPNPPSSFWETIDGKNNYLERLRRFEVFCEKALSLSIKVSLSYEKVKLFKQQSLVKYNTYKRKEKADMTDKVKISFSWDMHYKCNYRCPYCWWHGRWQDLARVNKYPSMQELLKYWTNIYNKYGEVHIELLGGEPFIYPGFNDLTFELSKMHTLGITTNLSANIENFVQRADPGRVKVAPTFHPYSADFNSFLNKALLLKQKCLSENVYYLAYPPQIKLINFYKEKFAENGIQLLITTFWGKYDGVEYPAGYKEEERAVIEGALAKRCNEEYQVTPKKDFKGKLCNAGRYYGAIQPDGRVVRCGGSGLNEVVGNFFDDNFTLFDEPLPCNADTCKCNEWAFLIEKDVSPNE